jgi:hypothetical protein
LSIENHFSHFFLCVSLVQVTLEFWFTETVTA